MLICIQKINLITHFFFKTLQKNSKHVILGKLGMPGHTHLQWWYQFEEIFDVYLEAKNRLHYSCFPWDISKILQTCYFGYFGQVWLHKPKQPIPDKNSELLMDRQTEDSDFIGPSVGHGSKKSYLEQKSVTLFDREKIIAN